MRQVAVCVGSSCHLKGAYDVINELKRLIAENSLEIQVELKACFCLGECCDGVNARIDGQIYSSLSKDNVAQFFADHVLENHL